MQDKGYNRILRWSLILKITIIVNNLSKWSDHWVARIASKTENKNDSCYIICLSTLSIFRDIIPTPYSIAKWHTFGLPNIRSAKITRESPVCLRSPTHIVLCRGFVYLMLAVSLDCLFVIAPSVFPNVYF